MEQLPRLEAEDGGDGAYVIQRRRTTPPRTQHVTDGGLSDRRAVVSRSGGDQRLRLQVVAPPHERYQVGS